VQIVACRLFARASETRCLVPEQKQQHHGTGIINSTWLWGFRKDNLYCDAGRLTDKSTLCGRTR